MYVPVFHAGYHLHTHPTLHNTYNPPIHMTQIEFDYGVPPDLFASIPVKEFAEKMKGTPEEMRILQLATAVQNFKVFKNTVPEHITKMWAEEKRKRNAEMKKTVAEYLKENPLEEAPITPEEEKEIEKQMEEELRLEQEQEELEAAKTPEQRKAERKEAMREAREAELREERQKRPAREERRGKRERIDDY